MKPAKFKKIKKEDLPELPEWWKKIQKEVKKSPLGKMSEKEIGKLCEELAERGARKRRASVT
ncbi:MAG: hypothetical protein EXS64_14750 [Candidatus Latescibacteria bacterium]|nr:hypothetical protein [Candidatus Latescibacterota bacterium]